MQAPAKNARILALTNSRLAITLDDARVLTGTFLAFDPHMNLVLSDTEETRTLSSPPAAAASSKAAPVRQKRTLGLIVLRGEVIVSISVERGPQNEKQDREKIHKIQSGNGTAKPTVRAVPLPTAPAPMPPLPMGMMPPPAMMPPPPMYLLHVFFSYFLLAGRRRTSSSLQSLPLPSHSFPRIFQSHSMGGKGVQSSFPLSKCAQES